MTVDWSAMRGLLIDLDGVVYTGSEPIAGAGEFIAQAKKRGLPFLLVTNNSTASPDEVARRLARMAIHVEPAEILTSAQAAAAYVRVHSQPGARIKLIGEDGLRQAALEEGLQVVDNGALDVEWVIAGLDRDFDYDKLTDATRAILAGARFLATNADALLPIEGGNVIPGAGTIVAAIQIATATSPIVVGKPEPGLFEHGLARLGGLLPADVAMIGDRIDTDVVGGQRAGLHTILVLSGVTAPQQLAAAGIRPDAVVPALASVADLFGWS
ncbi:MAG TPA: HAD-IIA family hydrolase [Chloroflexota bacterium]